MEELSKVIKDIKKGNRNAQALLYKKFAPTLYAICLRYCANAQDAEDCLHDGFIKIFSKIDRYNNKGSFEGWIKRIMVNLCIDRFRSRYEFVQLEEGHIEDEGEENIEEDLINNDERFLIEAIQTLSPKYRAVFNLYAIENYKHKEIAEQLDISESTSRSNYVRARKILLDKITFLKKEEQPKKKQFKENTVLITK